MTQTQELIEQVRTKLDGATDYKIAQVLDLHSEYIHGYVKGARSADAYACARIAEILERDPLGVIAQVEAEAARSEKKRAFWRTFFSGLKQTAHVVAWCGIVAFSVLAPQHGEAGKSSHNVYYDKYNLIHGPRAIPLICPATRDASPRKPATQSTRTQTWQPQ